METRPELLGCPEEIVSQFISYVDDNDLKRLRLTNKRLCASTTKAFGLAFFVERSHVVSAYSMNELLKITEHPVLGPLVKSIEFNAVYLIPGPDTLAERPRDTNRDDRFTQAALFEDVIAKIVSNITRNHGEVIVGVSDRHPLKNFGGRQLSLREPDTHHNYNLDETTQTVLKVTKLLASPLRDLKFDVGRRGRLHQLDLGLQSLRETSKSCLEPESTPFFLDIFSDRKGRDSNVHFSFYQGELCLTLLRLEVSDYAIIAANHTGRFALSYDYLVSVRITKLQLQQCTIVSLYALCSFFKHHSRRIESVTFEDVLVLRVDGLRWGPLLKTCESEMLRKF
ncbi:hypothetical protein E4T47_06013 [Aureobasidium subglaciale]|nr:hypothetical protein E4T47_06013 [Aureobasidium subglaciale]